MNRSAVVISWAVVAALASVAWGVPYASTVVQSGSDVSFILNEGADSVIVKLDGGASTLDLGALGKGTHGVNIGGAGSFEILVSKASAPGWVQISSDADTGSKYYSPKGVAVNQNAAGANFGRIYVGEGLGGPVGAGGRTTTDGLYIMGADQSDITSQGDTAHGGGIDWSASSNSPFRLAVAPDDNVYIADWSDGHSGVWRSGPSGAGGFDQMLANETNVNDGSGGLFDNHGSVAGVWVDGTGGDTKLYTIDEDFPNRGDVLRYDVGTDTMYAGAPAQQTQDGTNIILNGRMDLVRDDDGSWWVTQYRFTESPAAPSLTRFLDGGTEPVYISAEDGDLPLLMANYGSVDIHNGLDLLAMGARSGYGVYIIDISDPANPVLLDTVAQNGYTQDVAFDAAGNLYVVSSSSETLRIWSPGGNTLASTGSDGSFSVIPEPATMGLLALGGLALLRRRRLA